MKGLAKNVLKHFQELSPDHIKIPSIVKAELLYGAYKSQKTDENLNKLDIFLSPFEIVSFDSNVSQVYGEIRAILEKKGTPIGPNDLIIASIVLSMKGVLVTNNIKEFSRVKNLKTVDWS
jgi:tRNA(fMet)-specific endonuclease VapC